MYDYVEYSTNTCMITSYCVLVQMVVYEAARSLINLKNVTAREIQPAVSG